jgi:hypothetical protein
VYTYLENLIAAFSLDSYAMTQFSAIQKLLHICWPDVVEIDDAIFLVDALPSTGLRLQSFTDRTDAEAFYNHIHLLDVLPFRFSDTEAENISGVAPFPANTRIIIDDIARIVVDMWRTKLQRDFPGQHIRLYLTHEDEPILRFHVVRDDEAAWLDPADYQEQLASGTLSIYDTEQS